MNVKSFFKRFLLVICLVLLGFALASITVIVVVFKDEIKSLTNLEQIDDYGVYQMTYYGDYNLDKLLEKGINKDSDIGRFVTDNFTERLPLIGLENFFNAKLGIVESGCTAFITRNEKGDVIYGRNYDYIYSPSLVLKTAPENGYASVSTVNLRLLGFGTDNLPENLKEETTPSKFINMLILLSPYLPLDGMNEKGVAVSMLTVPASCTPYDPGKKSLNPTVAIRLILDKAANVDEALSLLNDYNIYFSGNIPTHFFIADESGRSVIVEFLDKEMKVIEADEDYQIASNFLAYDDRNPGTGYDRYDLVESKLKNSEGFISNNDALELLARVGVYDDGDDYLQWSVLYNLSRQDSELFAHRQVKHRTYFTLHE